MRLTAKSMLVNMYKVYKSVSSSNLWSRLTIRYTTPPLRKALSQRDLRHAKARNKGLISFENTQFATGTCKFMPIAGISLNTICCLKLIQVQNVQDIPDH